MTFFSSLDAKDRKLLLWCVGIAFVLAVAIVLLTPANSDDDNPLPSSYHAGRHGARAAYETLLRSGYPIERWERPLSELAAEAGPRTVVILAEPYSREPEQIKAVRRIIERGGRVLATGYTGGDILPGESVDTPKSINIAACKLEPEGLDALAGTGEIWMKPNASWGAGNPAARVEYNCAGGPAVVEYDWGKGHIVWWAGSTPLENGSLNRAANLDLLLNSLGPRQGHRFYWDESLHGEERSVFSFVHGPSWRLLWFGLLGMGVLIVFSFSRRSGPLRDLPPPTRATPIEFLEALGGLYRNAGAASTAISIALERFRRRALRLCGQRPSKMDAAELAAIIRRRFPQTDASLEADLTACQEAAWSQTATPKDALELIQALHGHATQLKDAARPGRTFEKL
ncbi:MAG: DUF4350 domain-containing protein [Terracidiphilus sp.]